MNCKIKSNKRYNYILLSIFEQIGVYCRIMFYMRVSAIVFLSLSLWSCKKDPEIIIIPNEVRYEVETFISEGEKRGVRVDLKGLRIILSCNLKNGWGGYYSHDEHVVYIDTLQPYYVSGGAYREVMLFHELGHGLLKREHINDLFISGDPKSIMHPTRIPNYTGLDIGRRVYYMDELFNPNTIAPEWAN